MKVIYDTCLYIDLLRNSKHLDLFRDRTHVRHLSSIVIMELRAGAKNGKQTKVIDQLIYPYSKAQRIVVPDANTYYKAGEILAKMGKTEIKKGFSHDILIALTAWRLGATVFTSNKKDFERIRRHVPIEMIGV